MLIPFFGYLTVGSKSLACFPAGPVLEGILGDDPGGEQQQAACLRARYILLQIKMKLEEGPDRMIIPFARALCMTFHVKLGRISAQSINERTCKDLWTVWIGGFIILLGERCVSTQRHGMLCVVLSGSECSDAWHLVGSLPAFPHYCDDPCSGPRKGSLQNSWAPRTTYTARFGKVRAGTCQSFSALNLRCRPCFFFFFGPGYVSARYMPAPYAIVSGLVS